MALVPFSARPTGPGTGTNSANSDGAGQGEAQSFVATLTGTITTIAVFVRAGSTATTVRYAIYADSAGSPGARLGAELVVTVSGLTGGAWNYLSGLVAPVTSGLTYWVAFVPIGGTWNYSDNAASGGNVKDSTAVGLTTLADPAPAYGNGPFANILNLGVMGDDGAVVAQVDLGSPVFLSGPDAPPGFFESLLLPQQSADVVTALADSDTGTGSEASDVQATVPGSDSSTGSEAGTVAATVDSSDSGTGTDTQTSLVIPIASTDSGTGTEAGTASVTAPGSDTSTGSESGTVSAAASGSESATGTDAGTAAVTTSSSDTASGTDTSSASVSAPGSDSGTGTDGGVVTETGAGGEGGAGFDTGTVSVTASGSDSGTGTDTGTVVDTTGGPDLISGADSGAGTELGTVLDLTPPAPPVVDTGPSGGTRVVDSDYGDETAIFPVEETRRVTGTDFGVGLEAGVVVDLTPRKPLRIRLPRRAAPAPAVEPEPVETFHALFDGDAGLATDTQALGVELEAADAARGSETDDLQDMSEGDAEELQILTLLGLL